MNYKLLIIFIAITSMSCSIKNSRGIPVLMYHQVVADDSSTSLGETVISISQFERQMHYLQDNGYTTISMDQLILFMNGQLMVPEKSVVLTFDDGWKNTLTVLPVLNKLNMKASFWIITDTLNDPVKYGNHYMTKADVINIDRNINFEIGAHSQTHPCNMNTWTGTKKQDIKYEINGSKQELEKLLSKNIEKFAWPCGVNNDDLIRVAKNTGFKALLTINSGFNLVGDSPFQIRRNFVNGKCNLNDFKEALEFGKDMKCY